MQVLFALELSVGLIDQTMQQAAWAVAPLEQAIVSDIERAALAHVDKTGWREAGQRLWLWVFVGPVHGALDAVFVGVLMSDGYDVYRARAERLRCWAHLLRKLRMLAESTNQRVAGAGSAMLGHFERLKTGVHAVCGADPPGSAPAAAMAVVIEALRQLCERHRDGRHDKLRELGREFCYDRAVIMRPLAESQLPLTNNEAKRALRHYVIARRISHGTRTPTTSRGYALLASVIETCPPAHGQRVIDLLAQAIDAAARKGLPTPALPPTSG